MSFSPLNSISVPPYLVYITFCPTLTSTGSSSPLAVKRPSPTATTSPWLGTSCAFAASCVSTMPADVSTGFSIGLSKRRSRMGTTLSPSSLATISSSVITTWSSRQYLTLVPWYWPKRTSSPSERGIVMSTSVCGCGLPGPTATTVPLVGVSEPVAVRKRPPCVCFSDSATLMSTMSLRGCMGPSSTRLSRLYVAASTSSETSASIDTARTPWRAPWLTTREFCSAAALGDPAV
mmetsp:Transcript_18137/g.48786  ORF Transcript_18137/g.48786 Transcript_18137/m.48786 type:complete len:234 (+) Transcript_18137:635-1336(+)